MKNNEFKTTRVKVNNSCWYIVYKKKKMIADRGDDIGIEYENNTVNT